MVIPLLIALISLMNLLVLMMMGGYLVIRPMQLSLIDLSPFLISLGTIIVASIASWYLALSNKFRTYLREFKYAVAATISVHFLILGVYIAVANLLLLAVLFWGSNYLNSMTGEVYVAFTSSIALLSFYYAFISTKDQRKKISIPSCRQMKKIISVSSGLLIAILIGAQLRIPIKKSLLTVNLADPIAVLAALSFITIWLLQYREVKVWRIPHMPIGLILFFAMILIGWFVAYWSYGGNQWASVNRVSGLLVLFSYLAAGAMFVAYIDRTQVIILIKIMIIMAIISYIIRSASLSFELLPQKSVMELMKWKIEEFNGLVANKNAFALQMLLILSVALVIPQSNLVNRSYIVLGIITFLILETSSRAAVLMGLCIFLATIYFKMLDFSRLLKIFGSVIFLFMLKWSLFAWLPSLLSNISISEGSITRLALLDFGVVQTDRAASLLGGLNMWLDSPFFGAGLGGFIESQEPVSLVIHNSVLWILAEMGLFGMILFMVLPISLMKHSLRKGIKNLEWEDAALLLVLLTVIGFSQFHEIVYQRMIWFIIGILSMKNQLFKK